MTCGSLIKLLNVHHRVRLHSHDVKYGSGSGQQSVTGTDQKEDVNSHWAIKGNNTHDIDSVHVPLERCVKDFCDKMWQAYHNRTQTAFVFKIIFHFSERLKGPTTHDEEFADEYSANSRRRIFLRPGFF